MSLEGKKIAVIGAGNLGQALLHGLLDHHALSGAQILVRTRRPERAEALCEALGVQTAPSNQAAAEAADIVILAVKPQILLSVAAEMREALRSRLTISVAAGIGTHLIENAIGGAAAVVRAMPNTPALIRRGATGLSGGRHSQETHLALAEEIFSQVGRVLRVDESQLDAVTGLSGSGPAYVFLILEAFADAGVRVGLSRETALELATQTIEGAAKMLQETGDHPGRLKDQVTSPGGTAIAGLQCLEEGGLRTTIMKAVCAATERAQALSREADPLHTS